MTDQSREHDALQAELARLRKRVEVLERMDAQRESALGAARASEERYRRLVEAVPGVLYEFVETKGGAYYSPQVANVLGHSPEHLCAHPMLWHDSIHPDDVGLVDRAIQQSRHTGKIEVEYRVRDAAGNWRWLLDRTLRVGGGPSDETRIEGLAVDITERRATEQALRDSEALLDAIVENIPDMIFVKDAAHLRFVRFNRAGEQLLGYTREELVGKCDYDFFPREAADFYTGKDRAVLAGDEVVDIPEERIETRLLGTRILHTKKVAVRDRGGAPKYLLGISEDITDRRRAEEALNRQKDRAQLYLDVAAVGLVALDGQGVVTLVNRRGCQILGGEESDVLGRNWFSTFLPERLREPVRAVFLKLMAGDVAPVEHYENGVLTCSGQERLVAFHNTVTRNVAGEIDGVLFSAHDITERRRAEQEQRALWQKLQQAQKLESLGVMAGGIAHDFNNILAVLLGNAELALGDVPVDHPAHPLLVDIHDAGLRAAELTGQMLAYSGHGKFVVEDVDVTGMVEEMTSLLKSSCSKNTALGFELASDLPAVRVDVAQLRQILLNLVINASDSLQNEPGAVVVRTYAIDCGPASLAATAAGSSIAEGRYVTLEVSDSGCGMDEETRARIFDPFFTTKFTGRGLGLAAVLGIVRGHDGAIVVESEPQHGTSIKVLLPALESVPEPTRKAQPAPDSWHGGGTILVVDDEPMVRKLASRVLQRWGFSVIVAEDGVDAIARFREQQEDIACVLLDLTMPRMGGEEALAELRRVREDVPVILCSGYAESDAEGLHGYEGLAGFVQKPYDLRRLKVVLREALGGSGQAAASNEKAPR